MIFVDDITNNNTNYNINDNYLKIESIFNPFLENLYRIDKKEQVSINLNKIQTDAYLLYQTIINNNEIENLVLYQNIQKVLTQFIIKYMMYKENKNKQEKLHLIMLNDLEVLENIMDTFYHLYLQFFEEYFIVEHNLTLIRDLYYKIYYRNIYQFYINDIYSILQNRIENILENDIDVSNLESILKLINTLEKYDNYRTFNTQIEKILFTTYHKIDKDEIDLDRLNNLVNAYKKQNYLYSCIFYHVDSNHYMVLKKLLDEYYLGKNINLLLTQNVIDLILEYNYKEFLQILSNYIHEKHKYHKIELLNDKVNLLDFIKKYISVNLEKIDKQANSNKLEPLIHIDNIYQFISKTIDTIDSFKDNLVDFMKDTLYKLCIKSNYINKRKINFSKLLNIYLHNLLINKDKINHNWLNIFDYLLDIIENKDEFIEYYQIYLKNRLLNKRIEYTQSNLKLEEELCQHLSSKIQMDIEYLNLLIKDIKNNMNSDIYIVNKFNWKPEDKYLINDIDKLPDNIISILDKHSNVYNLNYPNRKINWDLLNSSITYSFIVNYHKYKINSCLLDFIILSIVYENKMINRKDIIEQLERNKINNSITNLHLDNLIEDNIIQIEKETISINDKDINKNEIKIIKLPNKKKLANKEKIDEKNKYLFENRFFIIQSYIMKLVKYHKTIKYLDLKNRLIDKITLFKLDEKDIKLCIDKLIDRDYIERDINDTFIYVD